MTTVLFYLAIVYFGFGAALAVKFWLSSKDGIIDDIDLQHIADPIEREEAKSRMNSTVSILLVTIVVFVAWPILVYIGRK